MTELESEVRALVQAGWSDDAILEQLRPRGESGTLRALATMYVREHIANARARRGRQRGTGLLAPGELVEAWHRLRVANDRRPTRATLAEELSVSDSTVKRAIQSERAAGRPWPPRLSDPT